MRKSVLWQVLALTAVLAVGGSVVAQSPPDRGFGRGGPGGGLERALQDLKLPEAKFDTIMTAVRGNQENVNRMTEVVSAGLLLKIKDLLTSEEYTTLKDATDKVRVNAGGRTRVSEDDVVERIMAFDKNKTGKVTKEDLPERMQYLIEKGDTNKDGALDQEEVKKLAVDLAKEGTTFGGNRGGNAGGRGQNVARVSPGSGLTLGAIEKAVGDLKLVDTKKKEAIASAIKAQKEEASKLTTLVRSELQLEVSELLTTEEYAKVKTILDRQPAVGERPPPCNGQQPGGGRGQQRN